jgi:hypothetical protein
MESTETFKGYKRGSHLFFERNSKQIVLDLKDYNFYRPLKNGELKPFKGGHGFFRNMSVTEVTEGFGDTAYAQLLKFGAQRGYRHRRISNFATLFAEAENYKHLESYLVLGINFTSRDIFSKPANQFPKSVLDFMRESQINFDSGRWEANFRAFPEAVTNLCNHVRQRHYLDLEVYRMLYQLVSGFNLQHFILLTEAQTPEPVWEEIRYAQRKQLKETGYGCEYKTLFDYLVRIDRTEACSFMNALSHYRDYLKMMREMERTKSIGLMREINPDLDVTKIGYAGFGRIEKYPKYLRTRHDIVAKNYTAYSQEYDDKEFRAAVEFRYEYKKGSYKIIAPKVAQDIKNEGTTLHHCVASYIGRVLDGTTQILFMRERDEESLVTVEVRSGAIVQARGYNNRSVTQEEINWLRDFAKAKNLSYKDVCKGM